jgi:hypothetical protein
MRRSTGPVRVWAHGKQGRRDKAGTCGVLGVHRLLGLSDVDFTRGSQGLNFVLLGPSIVLCVLQCILALLGCGGMWHVMGGLSADSEVACTCDCKRQAA